MNDLFFLSASGPQVGRWIPRWISKEDEKLFISSAIKEEEK